MSRVHAVPDRIVRHYRCSSRRLRSWRSAGWLGRHGEGTGHPFPWIDVDVAAQIGWLRRLNAAGRILDNDDAAAGPRLRNAGVAVAIRIGDGRWVPYTGQDPTEAYTIALVNGPEG